MYTTMHSRYIATFWTRHNIADMPWWQYFEGKNYVEPMYMLEKWTENGGNTFVIEGPPLKFKPINTQRYQY